MVAFLPLRATCAQSMVALQKISTPAFNRTQPVLICLFVRSLLVKAPARDSMLTACPALSSPVAE
jgi:hypothetical protein